MWHIFIILINSHMFWDLTNRITACSHVLKHAAVCDVALQWCVGQHILVCLWNVTVHSNTKYCAGTVFWCTDLHLLKQRYVILSRPLTWYSCTCTHCNCAECACIHYRRAVRLYDRIMLQKQETRFPIGPLELKQPNLVVTQILLQWHWWMLCFICWHNT